MYTKSRAKSQKMIKRATVGEKSKMFEGGRGDKDLGILPRGEFVNLSASEGGEELRKAGFHNTNTWIILVCSSGCLEYRESYLMMVLMVA